MAASQLASASTPSALRTSGTVNLSVLAKTCPKRPASQIQASLTSRFSRATTRSSLPPRASAVIEQPTGQSVQVVAVWSYSQLRPRKRATLSSSAPTGQMSVMLPEKPSGSPPSWVSMKVWPPRSMKSSTSWPGTSSK